MEYNNEILPLDSSSSVKLPRNNTAFTPEIAMFYTLKANSLKTNIDQMAAEVHQTQDRMRLINDLIADINNLTNDKNQVDFSQQAAIQEKLQVIKQLGVKIDPCKHQYNSIERDRLIENLHLCGDNWDKQNKTSTQKMDIKIKELDRIMMLLKDVQKTEKQAIQSAISAARGA